MDKYTILDRTYDLIETKVPHFLFVLEKIRVSLAKKNSITFQENDNINTVIDNLDANVYLSVWEQNGWDAQISLLRDSCYLDITLDETVVATRVKTGYMEKILKKKPKMIDIMSTHFTVCIPLSLFIKYIPRIVSSHQINHVFGFLSSEFSNIMKDAVVSLSRMYIASYLKLKKEYPTIEITCYENKYTNDAHKYVLSSDAWIHLVISRFSATQIILLSNIFFSLTTIKKDIKKQANQAFEDYKNQETKST